MVDVKVFSDPSFTSALSDFLCLKTVFKKEEGRYSLLDKLFLVTINLQPGFTVRSSSSGVVGVSANIYAPTSP